MSETKKCIYFLTDLLDDTRFDSGCFKASCNNDPDDVFSGWEAIRHMKYCPYCGKEIYVMEERD